MILHDNYNITNLAIKLNAKMIELENEIGSTIPEIQKEL